MADLNQLRLVPVCVSVHISVFHTFAVHLILPRNCTISHLHPLMSAPICQVLSKTLSNPLRSFTVVKTEFSPLKIFDAHHGLNGRGCSLHMQIYISVASQADLITFNVSGLKSFCTFLINFLFLAVCVEYSEVREPWQ